MQKVITKTELMQLVIDGKNEEVFEDTEMGMFAVTRMRKFAFENQNKVKFILVDLPSLVEAIKKFRVYEEERINTLNENSWRNDPGILILHPGPPVAHTIIDGTHRALRRFKEGCKDMLFWAFDPSQAIIPLIYVESQYDWGDEIIENGEIVKRGALNVPS